MAEPTAQIDGSILQDVKQMLGQEWDDNTYDLDIMAHINSVFFDLTQIGVGPKEGFSISGPENLWSEFVVLNPSRHAVKTYIYIRVRLVFDAPATGPLVASLEKQVEKMEFRFQVENDPPYPPVIQEVINV